MVQVLLILQAVLVAGTGRLIDSKLGDVMVSDYRAVLRALERSYPLELGLPAGTLDTDETLMILLCNRENAPEIEQMMSEFGVLDFSGMGLRRLPVYGMQLMSSLKKVLLDGNRGLAMSKGDIEVISGLPIEEVSMRSSDISLETFRALQGLPQLTRLDVSDNELFTHTDSDRFGELGTRLVELNVSKCDLGSEWLDDILGCTNLESLDVSENPDLFSSGDPSGDRSLMGSLTRLNVSGCTLDSSWLDEILRCTNLTALDVSRNRRLFNGRSPSGDCSLMKNLISLNVSECHLDSSWLGEILECRGLAALDVSYCRDLFRDRIPGADSSFPGGLTRLSVSGCRLRGEWIDEILKCTNLTDLDISKNSSVGVDGVDFGKFKRLRQLRVLGAGDCFLTTGNLNEMCRCGGLEELDVSGNRGVWRGRVDFGECRLVKLSVARTEMDEAGLKSISEPRGVLGALFEWLGFCSEFCRLGVLDVSFNETLGAEMSREGFSFGGLERTLTELNVSNCGITSSRVIGAAGRCERLVKLDAASNPNLWGDEVDFGHLKSGLRELNIWFTRLQPGVLDRILEFQQLEVLDISHNPAACQGVGTRGVNLGGVRDTLRVLAARGTGLTDEGLRWMVRELRGLGRVYAGGNSALTPGGLVGLGLDAVGDRAVEQGGAADCEVLVDLERRVLRTWVY